MIIDTDVLIWFFRGNGKALKQLQASGHFSISCITQMELMQGARSKSDQRNISRQLDAWGTDVFQIDERISALASGLVKEYSLSHGIAIADALIAATALEHNETICTANAKHFDFIPHLNIKRFTP